MSPPPEVDARLGARAALRETAEGPKVSAVATVVERRTEQSALRLLEVLGTIRLEPKRGEVGRPYYVAQTSIDCIALLETPPGAEGSDGGSNSLRQWRRRE